MDRLIPGVQKSEWVREAFVLSFCVASSLENMMSIMNSTLCLCVINIPSITRQSWILTCLNMNPVLDYPLCLQATVWAMVDFPLPTKSIQSEDAVPILSTSSVLYLFKKLDANIEEASWVGGEGGTEEGTEEWRTVLLVVRIERIIFEPYVSTVSAYVNCSVGYQPKL